jgi:hypothetical protein
MATLPPDVQVLIDSFLITKKTVDSIKCGWTVWEAFDYLNDCLFGFYTAERQRFAFFDFTLRLIYRELPDITVPQTLQHVELCGLAHKIERTFMNAQADRLWPRRVRSMDPIVRLALYLYVCHVMWHISQVDDVVDILTEAGKRKEVRKPKGGGETMDSTRRKEAKKPKESSEPKNASEPKETRNSDECKRPAHSKMPEELRKSELSSERTESSEIKQLSAREALADEDWKRERQDIINAILAEPIQDDSESDVSNEEQTSSSDGVDDDDKAEFEVVENHDTLKGGWAMVPERKPQAEREASDDCEELDGHICVCSVDMVDGIQIECGECFDTIEQLQDHQEGEHY